MNRLQTEHIDSALNDLDLQSTKTILATLLSSQQQAVQAVRLASEQLENAVTEAAVRLAGASGRLILAGAGASGRLAVQDGAEMWPTYGWPADRLLLCMAGGSTALLESVEGVEDDAVSARDAVSQASVNADDVVVALAASGQSAWTVAWLEAARERDALTIGMANNADTPLLQLAQCPVYLDSGAEVLAGSTRMAAGTAQKIALNLFSTTLMIRLNRTYGNLMVDMAAVNTKLDGRRLRLLQGVLPHVDDAAARGALADAGGWVKLAALIASGDSAESGRSRLNAHAGSLRAALEELTARG